MRIKKEGYKDNHLKSHFLKNLFDKAVRMSKSKSSNEETEKAILKKINPFRASRKLSPPRKTSWEKMAKRPSTVPLTIADEKSLEIILGKNWKDSSKE